MMLTESEWVAWYKESYGYEPPTNLRQKYYGSKTLNIDIETYSDVDLKACGVYKYAASSNFQVMLFGYSYNNAPVKVIDLMMGESIPDEIIRAISDPSVIKKAYNANFERVCLSKHFGFNMPAEQWRCSAVQASICGLPQTLGAVGEALGFTEDKKKLGIGRGLINLFCKPAKDGKRVHPVFEPEKWDLFKEYCKRDVETEMEIAKNIPQISDSEQKYWVLDQKINDRGVKVNLELVKNAINYDNQKTEETILNIISITGISNPKSVAQIKNWIEEQTSEEVDSLNKKELPKLIEKYGDKVRDILELRMELSKTSTKKYNAILRSVGDDNRVRGLFQFYGANRTGRWAGRIVQVQNLPQNHLKDLEFLREILIDGKYNVLEMLCDSPTSVLSQLIRTVFIPQQKFIVVDFSAIEARILAWLANETWRIDVFNSHGKIYEASASQMFKVDLEKISKGNPEYALRQKGKIAELALGYGGGTGALISMGALDMGLTEDELKPLVQLWRGANINIVKLWDRIGQAGIQTCLTKNPHFVNCVKFRLESDYLTVELPSSRKLHYYKPTLETNSYGNLELSYWGVNGTSKKWEKISTYGPKLVENIVQAIARDCLAEAMYNLDTKGYDIVMHIHDEIVIDAKYEQKLDDVIKLLEQPLSAWVNGLNLKAAGFENGYYKKED